MYTDVIDELRADLKSFGLSKDEIDMKIDVIMRGPGTEYKFVTKTVRANNYRAVVPIPAKFGFEPKEEIEVTIRRV